MMTPAPLANSRSLSLDKGFYFSDHVYADLREIICHERPALFVLHYFFGMRVPYKLLMDRFFFILNKGEELEPCSNLLMDFFFESGILRRLSCEGSRESLIKLLQEHGTPNSALIIPTAKYVAGERLVTSVLVEGFGDQVLVSSLRGDDFYIRRPRVMNDLCAEIATDDGLLSCVTLNLSLSLIQPGGDEWLRAYVDSYTNDLLREKIGNFCTLRERDPDLYGSGALVHFVAISRGRLSQFQELHAKGFHNVLLAKVLWPMTFCYLPYVIARREMASLQEEGPKIAQLARDIIDSTGLAANMGHLFGKNPKAEIAERFFRTVDQLVAMYRELEAQLFVTGMGLS